MTTSVERVRAAYAAIEAADRPEVWIFLRPMADALVDAETVDAAVLAGADLPLAGLTAAVKNNVDVAGLATTRTRRESLSGAKAEPLHRSFECATD